MPKEHLKFFAVNGKRLILVVDDELINREILGNILAQDYELIYAADGTQAVQMIEEYHEILSLVLLDLLMPDMNGMEVLKHIRNTPELAHIPVIVMTSEASAEVESLRFGAIDFIPKPYNQPEVITARVRRTIELSEDRQIINSTERDSLTGLYNREYFYRYAEQYDQHHKDMNMDAIVVDVNHFHMINERYGKAYGDQVLRRIGEKVREMVRDSGGIVCRRESDTFMVYCPHRDDYKAILENASVGLAGDETAINRVRLRMGVYSDVDKSIDIERRFDRAKLAADTVRGSFSKTIAFYDSALHEAEIYDEQLLEDFHKAISERQFKVFYQPKFDIRPEIPVLASAEALVRWKHPKLGMISPGVFIPLFENNGLIQQLDAFVWREAAAQIRDWKQRFDLVVPVSVNVSRVDLYDPNLIDTLLALMEDFELLPSEFLLEITESAYTQDSVQIIETVNRLRSLGFQIEMDDFGTGYSSLNMISSLPIDALKLDMHFIRSAFAARKDTRMLEVIIDIADYLSVPVIAEGVETEEQLLALKAMGCDLVQGYYFSRPIPAPEYEIFIAERCKTFNVTAGLLTGRRSGGEEPAPVELNLGKIAHALSAGFESIYYVDVENDHYVEFSSQGKYEDLQIQRSGADFFAETQDNIPRVVYKEDQTRLALSMQKETLLAQLVGGRHFSITYRLVIEGVPTYYNLKAVSAQTRGNHHIVIGLSNVDEQMQDALNAEEPEDRYSEFITIAQALSNDFESVYYIDVNSDAYTYYTAQGDYEDLEIRLKGIHFFQEAQENLLQVVHPEDQQKVSDALNKELLLPALEKRGTMTVVYRLMIDGTPTYYSMKIVRSENDDHHIVIGIANVAAQMAEQVQQETVSYSRIAQALAQDYYTIYYVNTETERFIEYKIQGPSHALTLERMGEGFFDDCKRSIPMAVVPEDQEKALAAFDRETLLNELADGHVFSIAYRLIIDGTAVYTSLKALRLADDDKHIVIGLSDIDAQMKKQNEYEEAKRANVTYGSIAEALSQDYFSIYYVDTETDRFIEYSAHDEYRELNIEKGGDDFFNTSRRNILRVVYPEDREKIGNAIIKENLLAELEKSGIFTINYRLMFGSTPTWVSMKATRMEDRTDPHIVIGVSNIDAQMKREEELGAARALANRDALTGVKSKHAYVENEGIMNERLNAGTQEPFAMAVCDLNGLKTVNDTQGHAAGDRYIQDASRIICNTFKHSPVFRIGGDEFVAILRGQDYENRAQLLADLEALDRENKESGRVVIACGLSEFVAGQDSCVADVFKRADERMYRNKAALKETR